MNSQSEHPYFLTFKGSFTGILRWSQLDSLWEKILTGKSSWYVYAIGDEPPKEPTPKDKLDTLIPELNQLLRNDHDEDYCGIVYVDNKEDPTFIKIFDPNNLGTSCSISKAPPLPAWIISQQQPIDLPGAMPQTAQRKRWWQTFFS